MTDLHELMDRDPMDLSDRDIEQIVTELRKRRKQYDLGALTAGKTKPPTAAQKKRAEAAKVVGDLSDLGL